MSVAAPSRRASVGCAGPTRPTCRIVPLRRLALPPATCDWGARHRPPVPPPPPAPRLSRCRPPPASQTRSRRISRLPKLRHRPFDVYNDQVERVFHKVRRTISARTLERLAPLAAAALRRQTLPAVSARLVGVRQSVLPDPIRPGAADFVPPAQAALRLSRCRWATGEGTFPSRQHAPPQPDPHPAGRPARSAAREESTKYTPALPDEAFEQGTRLARTSGPCSPLAP